MRQSKPIYAILAVHLQTSGGAVVEPLPRTLKAQGSNPGWGGLLKMTQLFNPAPIDKTSLLWRSGRVFVCQTERPGFESQLRCWAKAYWWGVTDQNRPKS